MSFYINNQSYLFHKFLSWIHSWLEVGFDKWKESSSDYVNSLSLQNVNKFELFLKSNKGLGNWLFNFLVFPFELFYIFLIIVALDVGRQFLLLLLKLQLLDLLNYSINCQLLFIGLHIESPIFLFQNLNFLNYGGCFLLNRFLLCLEL